MQKSPLRSWLLLSAALFILWLLLTASLSADEIITGILVAVVAAVATPRLAVFSGFKLVPSAPLAILRYSFNFALALIKANIDMARRVLTPSLPLKPAVVEIQTSLQSELGKLLLANSITLTPGTLTIDVIGDRMLIHWIDAQPGEDIMHATREIAAGFERDIKGFLK
ncbi:MAG: Na+/H+ antiporter subunit E [Gammaproteobacteria bacterium]